MRSLSNHRVSPIAVLIVAFCIASNANGQDDLFGGPPDLGRPEAATEPAGPFEQQLLGLAKRGNRQMGEALAALARTGRWTHVNRLLEELDSQTPNAASLLEIQKQIEPAEFLEMKLSDQLSDKARSALDKIAAAVMEQRQSPERLHAAVRGLDDESADRRLRASRTLIEGGNASIVALVHAAVAADPPADRSAILRALLRLGTGGITALRQLALYGNPQTKAGAIESLALIDAQANVVELLTALHSVPSTPQARNLANRYLSGLSGSFSGNLLDRAYAIETLVADLNQKQRTASSTDNDDQIVTVWTVDADRSNVRFSKTRSIYVAYRDASDAAARLRQIDAMSPSIADKCLSADLSYRIMIDPDWGDEKQIEEFSSAYDAVPNGAALSAAGLSRALQYAFETNAEAATIGLLRLIQMRGRADGGNEFLHGMGPQRSPLVVAAASPYPRIRYEAALTATQLAGESGFAGSSEVKQVLGEMVRLGDLPTAVIVETRPEVIAPIQQVVARLGYRSIVVHNVAQLEQCVALGGDIRMIVSKSQLSDFPPIELVDVVRRTNRGRRLPIVMYGINHGAREIIDPDLHGADATRWSGPIEWIEQPATMAAYVGILDRTDRQRRLPPLSTIDRQRYRREASLILNGSDSES